MPAKTPNPNIKPKPHSKTDNPLSVEPAPPAKDWQ